MQEAQQKIKAQARFVCKLLGFASSAPTYENTQGWWK